MQSSSPSEPVVTLKNIQSYITDVGQHYGELTQRQTKVGAKEIEEHEAERENTQSLLLFHEKLTGLLKKCNIRFLSEPERTAETNMEQVLNSILSVQNQSVQNQLFKVQDNKGEVQKAIDSLRSQVAGEFKNTFSAKINKLIKQFASSSESLLVQTQAMKREIFQLEATIKSNHSQYSIQIKQLQDQLTNGLRIIPQINSIQQEERKKGEVKAEKNIESDESINEHFESYFSMFNNLDTLKQNDWQIRENFKHKIVHPLKHYAKDTPIQEMDQVEVTLSICTLWKGVPHGLAIIQTSESLYECHSFRGVGVFNHGQLHNAPFICFDGYGYGYQLSKMQNGRPADESYLTYFYGQDLSERKSDASGGQYYTIQVDKERRLNGQGKAWRDDGSIYIGGYKNGNRTLGKTFELQRDRTIKLFQVKYDERGIQEIEKKEISKGHKNL